ncbi:unnamed protein product [Didymodactylos carnosus]|uniref:NAD(P)(+)--arginine ADP-ribosyltransferase n=1 Tax=Didymodactylos carnosus TaxID=1234261 RepID=A0A815D255_9BILA|nr:unnamed protein product [Didymodactylos carnosus]CAF4101350.1 unnamed protein product [Didymodactylos carnosus]
MNNNKLSEITSSNTKSHLFNDPYSNKINKEDFTLIWLDKTLDKDINDSRQISKLRQAVDDLKTYVDLNECENYIRSHEHENIVIVVSGTYGQHIVPNIHDLTQIKRIYVFCLNEASHIEWTKNYMKVNNNIFTQTEKLLESLKPYIRQYQQTLLIQKSIVDVENKTADFKWARLLIDTLIQLPPEPKAKLEMIETLRKHYHDNETQRKIIDEFDKNEKDESAVTWYTKETCIYKIVNRIFRQEQIDEIYNYRAFIKDLAEQLNQLYTDQLTLYRDEWGLSEITVYRGAGVGNHDIEVLKSNTGQLISFNGFLSTSPDEKLALSFLHGQFGSTDLTPVLFTYKIDINVNTTAFAEITEISAMNEGREVLFNPGAIFKIDHVKYDHTDKMWRVRLSSREKDFMVGQHYIKICMLERSSMNNLPLFASLLLEAGQIHKAEIFIARHFSENKPIDKETAESSNETLFLLGQLLREKGDYIGALDTYNKALDIWKETLPENHPDIAKSYNNIGLVYHKKGDYDNALDYYSKALHIWKETLPEKHSNIAKSYLNIGLVYHNKGDYDNALDYYSKALHICKETLPEKHPAIAKTYNNIGIVYHNKGDYDNAHDYCNKALDICKETLPEKHPDIATTYNNIGSIYQNKGDYDNAHHYCNKAVDIWKETLPENHPHIATSYNNIGSVYRDKRDYDNALDYFQKALDIWRETLPQKHLDIATSYNNIASVYRDKGDYDNALDHLQKALDNRKQTVPEKLADIAKSYNDIGSVYEDKRDYDTALDYFQKALDIWKETLPEKHPDIARSYSTVGLTYQNKGDCDNALDYLQKALDIWKETLPERHPRIAKCYNSIGLAYHIKCDYDNAHDY